MEITFRNLIVHDLRRPSDVNAIWVQADPVHVYNNVVYDVRTTSAGAYAFGIADRTSAGRLESR